MPLTLSMALISLGAAQKDSKQNTGSSKKGVTVKPKSQHRENASGLSQEEKESASGLSQEEKEATSLQSWDLSQEEKEPTLPQH